MICFRILIAILVCGGFALHAGCSRSDRTADASNLRPTRRAEINPEYKILKDIASKNRNTVHVALWTINNNSIETPKEIDFESPYKNSEQFLGSLAEDLAKMDPSQLNELDKSLAYHWQIYSPIWGPTSEDWD